MFIIQFSNGTYLTLLRARTSKIKWAILYDDEFLAKEIAKKVGGTVIELDEEE